MTSHDIADHNVERLLGVAYKPEPIDPAFTREMEERLLTAARADRVALEPDPIATAKLRLLRVRLSIAMATAAMLIIGLVSWYARVPSSTQRAREFDQIVAALNANVRLRPQMGPQLKIGAMAIP